MSRKGRRGLSSRFRGKEIRDWGTAKDASHTFHDCRAVRTIGEGTSAESRERECAMEARSSVTACPGRRVVKGVRTEARNIRPLEGKGLRETLEGREGKPEKERVKNREPGSGRKGGKGI